MLSERLHEDDEKLQTFTSFCLDIIFKINAQDFNYCVIW